MDKTLSTPLPLYIIGLSHCASGRPLTVGSNPIKTELCLTGNGDPSHHPHTDTTGNAKDEKMSDPTRVSLLESFDPIPSGNHYEHRPSELERRARAKASVVK